MPTEEAYCPDPGASARPVRGVGPVGVGGGTRPIRGSGPRRGQDGIMSEFLVVYLDSIDGRLLDYLDKDEELRLDTVRRLRYYTTALLDGSITPAALIKDWADWYDLVPAFVTAYTPEWLEQLQEAALFLDGPEIGADALLSDADRAYLLALEPVLDMYPEMRNAE